MFFAFLKNLLNDASFYVAVSFFALVIIGFIKGRKKINRLLNQYKNTIQDEVKQAENEREQSFNALKAIEEKQNNVPEEISEIVERHTLDPQQFQIELDKELEKVQRSYDEQYQRLQDLKIQQSYVECVERLCEKFCEDMKTLSPEQHQQLFDQSLDLISKVHLK